MDIAYVVVVATLPEYRNQGLMARLLKESLKILKQRGICITHLYPFLHAFYERFGFQGLKEGDLPPYFRKLWRLVNSLPVRLGQAPPMSVMRWDSPL
jgi:GNAT superfamily N-acetyltransferase